MDALYILQAVLLGIIEGLTEFLPVSSTGHLILVEDLLGFQGPEGRVFEIVIQLGAVLAICVLYFKRLMIVARNARHDIEARIFIRNILLSFVPAVIVGVVAYPFIRDHLFNPWVVSVMLIVGGILILIIERNIYVPKYFSVESIPARVALKIGLFQCLAMIPGTSRSGATIIGSLLMKVERKTAAEYSFFLAIPTMLGATAKSLYTERHNLHGQDGLVIALGFTAAFLTALVVVKAAVNFISKHGFTPFAYYRIVIGTFMLVLLLLR